MHSPRSTPKVRTSLAQVGFYALFVVAGVAMAINFMLELLHKALNRITGRAQ